LAPIYRIVNTLDWGEIKKKKIRKEKKIKEHIEPQEELSMEMARAATAATGLAKLN